MCSRPFNFFPNVISFQSQTLLSSSSGSKSSSLPGSSVLVWAPARLALFLRVWQGESVGVGLSGMKKATINATTTEQAPRRNGGPGELWSSAQIRWQESNIRGSNQGFMTLFVLLLSISLDIDNTYIKYIKYIPYFPQCKLMSFWWAKFICSVFHTCW